MRKASSAPDTAEQRAYREAGHAAMSYLIRRGLATKLVPRDLSLILPAFENVSIKGSSADWGEITFSLGSLLAVPQVIIAGYLAEQLKRDPDQENLVLPDTSLAKKVRQLIGGYLEEYGRENTPRAQREKQIDANIKKMTGYVGERLRTHWAAVEALAQALLLEETLSESRAFEIIEQKIPDQVKAKARPVAPLPPFIQRFVDEAEEEASTKPWWKFWRK